MANETNQPNYRIAAYNAMSPAWQIVNDVTKGTIHLRKMGRTYLPLEPAEDLRDFEIRRSRAVFFNAFERTLHGLVGMVFRKEPTLEDDVPEVIRGREAEDEDAEIEGHAENIDLAGTHWAVFAKEIFTDAMRDGHALIYVDMPPALGEGATLADERAANRRPYWVSYRADQVFNWRTEVVNGQTRLAQVTLYECTMEAQGTYGEQEVKRYRVLRPGSWELWRETNGENGRVEYVLESSGLSSLSEIPIAIVYSRKTGYLTSRPPLLDLALINIAHYQKYSDLSTYLHIASRPILWFRGRNTAETIAPVGPYTFFDVSDNGVVDFAETSGAALGAAREDLLDLEQRMSVLGLSLLSKKNPTPTTATEELLTSVKEESDLATAARSLKDALELALLYHAQYLDPLATTGGSVTLGSSVSDLTLTAQDLTAYSGMVASKQLSLETLWSVLERGGRLPEGFDAEVERERLENEMQTMAEALMRNYENGQEGSNDANLTQQ